MTRLLTHILAFFAALSIGALSFVGMLVLINSVPLAVASFFFAAIIEHQVYMLNIEGALQNLWEGPIVQLKTRIFSKKLDFENHTLEIQQIRKKVIAIIISGILALGAAISCALATAAAFAEGLPIIASALGLVIAPSLATIIIVASAIFAGLGYGLIMYKNLLDMVHDDMFQEWYRKARDLLSYQEDETTFSWKRIKRIALPMVGMILITGLAVFAAVSTAGTWWGGTQKILASFSWISQRANNIISATTILMMSVPNFLFGVVKSIESIAKVFARTTTFSISNSGKNLYAYFADPIRKNPWQSINPFYWISKIISPLLHPAIFFGHLWSIGVSADRLGGVDPKISAILNSAAEAGTDATCFLETEDPSLLDTIANTIIDILNLPVKAVDKLYEKNSATPIPQPEERPLSVIANPRLKKSSSAISLAELNKNQLKKNTASLEIKPALPRRPSQSSLHSRNSSGFFNPSASASSASQSAAVATPTPASRSRSNSC